MSVSFLLEDFEDRMKERKALLLLAEKPPLIHKNIFKGDEERACFFT